jgi:type II secretory pathway component GspD/PulD (secretin)
MVKFVCSTIAALALCVGTARAQGIGLDARVDLRVEQRSLADVIQFLRERSGANIVLKDPGDLQPITLELSNVAWRDALDIAASLADCVVDETQGGVLSVERPQRVTWQASNASITEIIEMIAKLSNANIVVAPEVQGTISLNLQNVPWRNALDVAVKTLGFVVVEEARGILRVVDPKTLQSQMVTKSYQMRYLRPRSKFKPNIKSEFLMPLPQQQQQGKGGGQEVISHFSALAALKKALSEGGDMDYIESSNVIIVRDTVAVHKQIEDMLRVLDIEPAQVFVDVKFVSTVDGDMLDLGVDYGDAGPSVSLSGGRIPVTFPFDMGPGGWDDGLIVNTAGAGPFADPLLNSGATTIPDTIFGALSFTEVNATLKMIQRDTKSEVIQAPKLIAVDGTEATIFVGETVRYAEAKSEQGQAGGLQLSLSEAGGSPVDTGFQLLIVPHVVPGTNQLTLDVVPKETSLSGTGQSSLAPAGFDVFTVGASGLQGSIALPRTRSSTIVTTMLLESGQTAFVGGLANDADTVTKSRVPFVSSIPVLGELFKHEKKDRTRRTLLVFLTPTLVHSAQDQEALMRAELKNRRVSLGKQLKRMSEPKWSEEEAAVESYESPMN